ncbi:MAG: rhodanese-related sulfurtransferase [Leptolyngbya sp. RL_3_1]|nr:rhodanese-related sulfurtransferase [Leptolyngbya sp. RL_3_1]
MADCEALRAILQAACDRTQLRGTILLAPEGINATVAGEQTGIDHLLHHFQADARFADLAPKLSSAPSAPFGRMKVKVKPEIVTLGQPQADPSQQVGTYVNPQDWNQLIQDPEVTVIDARNGYEVAIGSFQGAVNPQTAAFRQLPDYVATHLDPAQHKKVALFCTGGIRCEKATSYLLHQGFESVYHLQGGILKYLEDIPPERSLWQGECFVFDERVAVTHGVQPGSYDMCRACGHPISQADQARPEYVAEVSCPHCHGRS